MISRLLLKRYLTDALKKLDSGLFDLDPDAEVSLHYDPAEYRFAMKFKLVPAHPVQTVKIEVSWSEFHAKQMLARCKLRICDGALVGWIYGQEREIVCVSADGHEIYHLPVVQVADVEKLRGLLIKYVRSPGAKLLPNGIFGIIESDDD